VQGHLAEARVTVVVPTGIADALKAPNAQATLQVVTDDAGCFDAVLTTVRKNTNVEFTANKP
jgi:hypothetical protein